VHYRFAKVALGIAAVAALPMGRSWALMSPAPQAPAAQESPYKDQGEYDLAVAAQKEADPHKKLDKLKEWEQKYPGSKLAGLRSFFQASALIQIALGAYGKTGPPDLLDEGQKDAKQVVDNFDPFFNAGAQKFLNVPDDKWAAAKHLVQLQAHSALGWIAMQKRDWTTAETEFKKVLELDPANGQVDFWLGSAIIGQKNVVRYSEAMYDLARGIATTGPGAIPAAAQKVDDDYLTRVYAGYHGDDLKDPKIAAGVKDDISKLKQQAMSSPVPPADFHIKDANQIAHEQFANEEEFNKAHPDIFLWRTIRTALTAPDGEEYFGKIKETVIPPPEIGMLKAKIVSLGAKEIVAGIDNAAGDVTLQFEKAVNQKVLNTGDAFEFKGELAAFTKAPYMLTIKIDDPKEEIKGLPADAFTAGAPAKKTVRRPAPRKK